MLYVCLMLLSGPWFYYETNLNHEKQTSIQFHHLQMFDECEQRQLNLIKS